MKLSLLCLLDELRGLAIPDVDAMGSLLTVGACVAFQVDGWVIKLLAVLVSALAVLMASFFLMIINLATIDMIIIDLLNPVILTHFISP